MLDQTKAFTADPGSLHDAEYLLSFMQKNGIISPDDVRKAEAMKKKEQVLTVHKHTVSQGKGKDKRWFTRVDDPQKKQYRRIAGNTEEDIFEKLYQFYFAENVRLANINLQELYPEWRAYKLTVTTRPNTVKRLDSDFKRCYLNEPLSRDILNKPLSKIGKLDIETWGYALIKEKELTKKQFFNLATILKQVLDYYGDLGYGHGNPFNQVHFRQSVFRRTAKKAPQTQIFYPDELKALCDLACSKAKASGDESFLAIPLIRLLGLRVSECLGLAFEDFDRVNNLVHIRRSFAVVDELKDDGSWDTRRYKVLDYLKQNAPPRTILASDECFEIVEQIRRLLEGRGIRREYLFEVKTPNNIQMKMYQLCDELGIERRSPHKLRKTYVSQLMNHGFDQDFVRGQVGHQAIQTTLNFYVYSTTRNEDQILHLNEVL